LQRLVEKAGHIRAIRYVAIGVRHVRIALCKAVERRAVDVRHMHPRSLANEGARNLQPDPARPGGDEDV
jgi:hypothetical protein